MDPYHPRVTVVEGRSWLGSPCGCRKSEDGKRTGPLRVGRRDSVACVGFPSEGGCRGNTRVARRMRGDLQEDVAEGETEGT